jgi:hypothetical protein
VGVARGAAGLVVKPVAGVLDFAARTTEGLVASAKALAGDRAADARRASRRRHARLLWGIDHALVPLDAQGRPTRKQQRTRHAQRHNRGRAARAAVDQHDHPHGRYHVYEGNA